VSGHLAGKVPPLDGTIFPRRALYLLTTRYTENPVTTLIHTTAILATLYAAVLLMRFVA
jgi:hypothetical protein